MAVNVGELEARLTLDTSRYVAEMRRAASTTTATANEIKASVAEASQSVSQLTPTVDGLTGAMKRSSQSTSQASATLSQYQKDVQKAGDEITRAAERWSKLNEQIEQSKKGSYESAIGVGKAARETFEAAKAEQQWGFAMGSRNKALAQSGPLVNSLVGGFARLGENVIGIPRALGNITDRLPGLAVGGLAAVGAIALVADKISEIQHAYREWADSSRATTAEAERSAIQIGGALRSSALSSAEAWSTANQDIIAASRNRTQRVIEDARSETNLRINAIQDGLQRTLNVEKPFALERLKLTKAANEAIALEQQKLANVEIGAREQQLVREIQWGRDRIEINAQSASAVAAAEAGLAQTRLAIDRDTIGQIRNATQEKLRIVDDELKTKTRAFEASYTVETGLLDRLTEANRAAAVTRQKIALEGAEQQEQATRKIFGGAADLLRQYGDQFKDTVKSLDIKEAASRAKDNVDLMTNAYRAGAVPLRDYTDFIINQQDGLRKLGATQEQQNSILNQTATTAVRAAKEQANAFAEVNGVYTNLLGSIKSYVQSTDEVIKNSTQVTEKVQQQMQANKDLVDSWAAVQRSASMTAEKVNELADAYEKAKQKAKELEDIQTKKSLDDSLAAIGLEARRTEGAVTTLGSAYQQAASDASQWGAETNKAAGAMATLANAATTFGLEVKKLTGLSEVMKSFGMSVGHVTSDLSDAVSNTSMTLASAGKEVARWGSSLSGARLSLGGGGGGGGGFDLAALATLIARNQNPSSVVLAKGDLLQAPGLSINPLAMINEILKQRQADERLQTEQNIILSQILGTERTMTGSITNTASGIASLTGQLGGWMRQGALPPRMQHGGVVTGSGRGDTVPALLEPGEVVVPRNRASAALAIWPELAGGAPRRGRYQRGGLVEREGAPRPQVTVNVFGAVTEVNARRLAREIAQAGRLEATRGAI